MVMNFFMVGEKNTRKWRLWRIDFCCKNSYVEQFWEWILFLFSDRVMISVSRMKSSLDIWKSDFCIFLRATSMCFWYGSGAGAALPSPFFFLLHFFTCSTSCFLPLFPLSLLFFSSNLLQFFYAPFLFLSLLAYSISHIVLPLSFTTSWKVSPVTSLPNKAVFCILISMKFFLNLFFCLSSWHVHRYSCHIVSEVFWLRFKS